MEFLQKIEEALSSPRMKSFYWRAGAQMLSAGLAVVSQSLMDWNPSATITVVAGLIIAEITKYLNSKPKK